MIYDFGNCKLVTLWHTFFGIIGALDILTGSAPKCVPDGIFFLTHSQIESEEFWGSPIKLVNDLTEYEIFNLLSTNKLRMNWAEHKKFVYNILFMQMFSRSRVKLM